MSGRAASYGLRVARGRRTEHAGSALVEVALVTPLLLLLAFGVVGIGQVTQAQMGVSAVAREAARAAAIASSPAAAASRGLSRGEEVAAGYQLTNGSLQLVVDPGSLARGGQVRAQARYEVRLGDLPLLGWARVTVASDHVERTDLYGSRWQGAQP